MKLFLIFDLWFALLTGVPEDTSEATPPPSEHAAAEADDDEENKRWFGYLWTGPSINNGY